MKFRFLFFILLASYNGLPTEENPNNWKKVKPCKNWRSLEDWSTGHKGNLEFIIPEDKKGWKVRIMFNQNCTILQAANAKTTPGSNQTHDSMLWMLSNKDFNPVLKRGEIFLIKDVICSHNEVKSKNQTGKVMAAVLDEGIDICNKNSPPSLRSTDETTTLSPKKKNAQKVGTHCGARVESGHSWNKGQNGKLFITFPVDVEEWTVELVLDRLVNKLDVHQGVVNTQDGLTYIITNRNYNGKNSAEATLQLTWQIKFDVGVGAPEVVAVSLVRVDCGAEVVPTNQIRVVTKYKKEMAVVLTTTKEPIEMEAVSTTTKEPIEMEVVSITTKEPMQMEVVSTTTKEPREMEVVSTTTNKPIDMEVVSSTTKEPIQMEVVSTTTNEPREMEVVSTTTTEPIEIEVVSMTTKDSIETDIGSTRTRNSTEKDVVSKEPIEMEVESATTKYRIEMEAVSTITEEPIKMEVVSTKDPAEMKVVSTTIRKPRKMEVGSTLIKNQLKW